MLVYLDSDSRRKCWQFLMLLEIIRLCFYIGFASFYFRAAQSRTAVLKPPISFVVSISLFPFGEIKKI